MYGSQFHSQLTLTIVRPSALALQEKRDSLGTKRPKKPSFLAIVIVVLVTAFASHGSFAGPSQPRVKGGNGNAQGR